MAEDQQWVVLASQESHACVNPVRSCEELYFTDVLEKRDKSKELIKLSIGKQPPPLPPPQVPLPLHIQTLKTKWWNDDTQYNEYYSKCVGGEYFEDPNKAMFILQYDSYASQVTCHSPYAGI